MDKHSASMLKNWIADERVQFMYAEPVYATEQAVKGLPKAGSNYL